MLTDTQSLQKTGSKFDPKGMLNFAVKSITKPSEALTKDVDQFADFKNSAIFAGAVALIGVIINVVTTMIIAVNSSKVVKSLFGSSSTSKNELNWDALKDVDYGTIIFKTLLGYVLVIAIAAGIYYIASSVAKKQANFLKLIAVSSVALLFYLVISQIIAVVIMKFSVEVGLFVSQAGLIYALVLAYEGLNFQIFGNNTDKQKIFMNIVALVVIAILFHYVKKELLVETSVAEAAGALDSVNNLLKSLK